MSYFKQTCLAVACGAMAGIMQAPRPSVAVEPAAGSVIALFNGRNLDGWVNVNGAPATWSVRDGAIVCSGKPSGFLRTAAMYENYVLEWETRHAAPGGNSGMFFHADALPQVGAPYPRSIEVQLLDGDHGSIFGIRGAAIVPQSNPDLKGTTPCARPIEDRCRPAGQWNRYVLTSRDGTVELEVNGKVVTRATGCSQRKGYLCLQSEGTEVSFRNLRLTPLPGSSPSADRTARADEGFRSLFDGLSFAGWRFREAFRGHWVAQDGMVRCDGKVQAARDETRDLWSEGEFGDFIMVVDWRLPAKPTRKKLPTFTPDGLYQKSDNGGYLDRELDDAGDSGVFVRGDSRAQVNIWSQPMGSGDINDYHKDAGLSPEVRRACMPLKRADRPFGEWNRFVITMRGDRVTVVLNDETVIDRAVLPGVPARGRVGLQNHNDPIEFRNLFIKELK